MAITILYLCWNKYAMRILRQGGQVYVRFRNLIMVLLITETFN